MGEEGSFEKRKEPFKRLEESRLIVEKHQAERIVLKKKRKRGLIFSSEQQKIEMKRKETKSNLVHLRCESKETLFGNRQLVLLVFSREGRPHGAGNVQQDDQVENWSTVDLKPVSIVLGVEVQPDLGEGVKER